MADCGPPPDADAGRGYAINLNRAVLVSPALNFEITTNAYALIYPMSLVPTQAAIAAFTD